MSVESNKNWYVVYTRPRWEKKVARTLEEKGIEVYCPLNKVLRRWSDRNKVILEPLFKGYVFVKVDEQHKWDIRQIDGILNYVYWLGKPARVKEEEIDLIRKFLMEFSNVEVIQQNMERNTEVIIRHGLLMNYKGIVLDVMGNKAKVRIDSMGVQLSAIFDKKSLEPLSRV